MKTKHTPGPWEIIHTEKNPGKVDQIHVGKPDYTVCRVMAYGENAMANARLIAAAPDLLKALKDLVERCDGEEGIQADGSNMDTLSAHMVIQLAEGEE